MLAWLRLSGDSDVIESFFCEHFEHASDEHWEELLSLLRSRKLRRSPCISKAIMVIMDAVDAALDANDDADWLCAAASVLLQQVQVEPHERHPSGLMLESLASP